MLGGITWNQGNWLSLEAKKEGIAGHSYLHFSLREEKPFRNYRLKKLSTLAQGYGITRFLFPRTFPFPDALPQFRPYDPVPILQTLGDKMLLGKLAEVGQDPHRAKITLVGDRCTTGFVAVARGLCPHVEELVLQVKEGRESLQQRLYQEFGVAPSSYREKPTATLFFSPPVPCEGLWLSLGREEDFHHLPSLSQDLPHGISPTVALALSLEKGKLKKESLDFT